MCQLCKTINQRMSTKVPLDEKETRQYLDAISKEMKSGKNHFQKVLDKVLGTEMTKPDAELDAAWEANRKSSDG